jgi:hypothetical protein
MTVPRIVRRDHSSVLLQFLGTLGGIEVLFAPPPLREESPVNMRTASRIVAAVVVTVAVTLIGAGTASAATAAPQSSDGCWIFIGACKD